MDKSKKIVTISFIPCILTVVFIISVLIPTFGHLYNIKNKIKDTKEAIEITQTQLDQTRNNENLRADVFELKKALWDFDIKVPEKDELAVFVVDLGKFALNSNVKLVNIKTDTPSEITIEKPGKKGEANKEKTKRVRTKKKGNNLPVSLTQIPVQIDLLGRYPDILEFINALEHYQRKVVIESTSMSDEKKDKQANSNVLEVTIKCNIYKLTKQEVIIEEKPQKEGNS